MKKKLFVLLVFVAFVLMSASLGQDAQDPATPTEAPVSDPTPEAVQELSALDVHATKAAANKEAQQKKRDAKTMREQKEQELADAQQAEVRANRDAETAAQAEIDAWIDVALDNGFTLEEIVARAQARMSQATQQDEPSS